MNDNLFIGVFGDQHHTGRRPLRRRDDYPATLRNKFRQSLQACHNCDVLVQVGDFFDTPYVSNKVISEIIEDIRESQEEYTDTKGKDRPFYVIFGQHDISGHTEMTLPNSPLNVLQAAGCTEILDSSPRTIQKLSKSYRFYGASFGQEVPGADPEDYNILVTHQMIGDRPLYPGQDLQSPKKFLADHPEYNLVLCGDYHYRFTQEHEGHLIINPGALTRKTISSFDLEHTPAVMMVAVPELTFSACPLDIQPVEEVFDFERGDLADNEILMEFIRTLAERTDLQSTWREVLPQVLKELAEQDPGHDWSAIRTKIEQILVQVGEDQKGDRGQLS